MWLQQPELIDRAWDETVPESGWSGCRSAYRSFKENLGDVLSMGPLVATTAVLFGWDWKDLELLPGP